MSQVGRPGEALCELFDRRRQEAQLFNALGRGCSERWLPNECSRCVPTQHSEQCAYVAVNSVMPGQDDRSNLNYRCI